MCHRGVAQDGDLAGQTVNTDRSNWCYIFAKSAEHNADSWPVMMDDHGSELVEVTHQRVIFHLFLPRGVPVIECLFIVRPKVLHHKRHRSPEHYYSKESEQNTIMVSFLHITKTRAGTIRSMVPARVRLCVGASLDALAIFAFETARANSGSSKSIPLIYCVARIT